MEKNVDTYNMENALKMPIFDTHAHYDQFNGEGPAVLKRMIDENVVNGVVIPAISYESNFNRELFPEAEYPNVYFAAGVHPKNTFSMSLWHKKQIEEFNKIIDSRTVAIKTGLDHCKSKVNEAQYKRQKDFFKLLLQVANERKLPVVLHIREASEEAVEVLKEIPPQYGAVVHCFTYDKTIARKFFDMGVTYLGIGGKITKDELPELKECVAECPIEKILLETDAPYVKTKGAKERYSTSESLMEVARYVADIKGMTVEDVINCCNKSAREFFNI